MTTLLSNMKYLLVLLAIVIADRANAQFHSQPTLTPPIDQNKWESMCVTIIHGNTSLSDMLQADYQEFRSKWLSAATDMNDRLKQVQGEQRSSDYSRMVVQWNLVASTLSNDFVELAKSRSDAEVWTDSVLCLRRELLWPELQRLNGEVVDPEMILSRLELTPAEVDSLRVARQNYAVGMDAALKSWRDSWYAVLVASIDDRRSIHDVDICRKREAASAALILSLVRDTSDVYVGLLSPQSQHRFSTIVAELSLPKLFAHDAVDVAIETARKMSKHISADEVRACEYLYLTYTGQRLSLRERFISENARWMVDRSDSQKQAEHDGRIPHYGVETLARLDALEMHYLRNFRSVISRSVVDETPAFQLLFEHIDDS